MSWVWPLVSNRQIGEMHSHLILYKPLSFVDIFEILIHILGILDQGEILFLQLGEDLEQLFWLLEVDLRYLINQ